MCDKKGYKCFYYKLHMQKALSPVMILFMFIFGLLYSFLARDISCYVTMTTWSYKVSVLSRH